MKNDNVGAEEEGKYIEQKGVLFLSFRHNKQSKVDIM
jgi:hypothetical protein